MSTIARAEKVIRDHGFDVCCEPRCVATDLYQAGVLAPEGLHWEYVVEARYTSHEWAGTDWYPCDRDGNTRIDHHDNGKPARWVGPYAWRALESAQRVAEQERGWEDRNVRIVRRLVTDPEVVE